MRKSRSTSGNARFETYHEAQEIWRPENCNMVRACEIKPGDYSRMWMEWDCVTSVKVGSKTTTLTLESPRKQESVETYKNEDLLDIRRGSVG